MIYSISTKIVKEYFKFFISPLQCKVLCYLSRVVEIHAENRNNTKTNVHTLLNTHSEEKRTESRYYSQEDKKKHKIQNKTKNLITAFYVNSTKYV
jgi:hypothetical protein